MKDLEPLPFSAIRLRSFPLIVSGRRAASDSKEIVLNTAFRSSWRIGGWLAAVALVVAASVAMGANLSTTALLFALGIAPAIVIVLLAHGAASPSVAQILRAVETKDGR